MELLTKEKDKIGKGENMENCKMITGGIILFWFFSWLLIAEITDYLDERKWKKTRNWDDKD